MHYSDKPNSVRVDFFKLPSYKWYATEQLNWTRYTTKLEDDIELIHTTFARLLHEQIHRYHGMLAVCLEPYHEHAHPLCIVHEQKHP